MIEAIRLEAERYLTPPRDAFWEWADGGAAIVWRDGPTICFRSELGMLIGRLASDGLPPLGAVLLLVAATHDWWPDRRSRIFALDDPQFPPADEHLWLHSIQAGLDRVHQLTCGQRGDLLARKDLIESVFSVALRHTSPLVGDVVLEMLEQADEWFPPLPRRQSGSRELLQVFGCLRPGLELIHGGQFPLRRETGLDELPQPAEVELPPAQRVRMLIRSLLEDDELGGLARLARDMMAAATIPRSVSEHEDLPVGGLSDISNRGPLDRLLLSELANDSLTLAVRVAMNEAMYLRRESPPRTPPRQRPVLIESGVRSWGVPRVFSAAVALAFAALTDEHTEITVWRADGDGVQPVDLTTRSGLIEHLSVLTPDVHPGAALRDFCQKISGDNQRAEPVLIVESQVLTDPDFQSALAGAPDVLPAFVAAVDREGHFRLWDYGPYGRRSVKEARLDLQTLFREPERKPVSLRNPDEPQDLPAIFRIIPFPLLLPHDVDWNRTWSVRPRGVLSLTRDRRLMYWRKPEWGAVQISQTVPAGPLVWTQPETDSGPVLAIVGDAVRNGLHLLRIDLERMSCQILRLDVSPEPWQTVQLHRGLLYFSHRQAVEMVSPDSGRRVTRWGVPDGVQPVYGRLYRCQGQAAVLSHDGISAQLLAMPQWELRLEPGTGGHHPLLDDELLIVTDQGDIPEHRLPSQSDPEAPSVRRFHLAQPSLPEDLAAAQPSSSQVTRLSNARQQARIVLAPILGKPRSRELPMEARRVVTLDNIWHRFTAIAVDSSGLLTLKTRKEEVLKMCLDTVDNKLLLVYDSRTELAQPIAWRTFRDGPRPPGVGFTLRTAEWTDGRQAILDSRGLLHLKSRGHALAEVTIVLRHGRLAGWTSPDGLWGRDFYTGGNPGTDDVRAFKCIESFCRDTSS